MRFIADLHIHSHYSLATSKELSPEYLDLWARIKGIGLVATGDFTHPKWIAELREKLVPAEPGLYKLNPSLRIKLPYTNELAENSEVRFVLSSEISSIYKKNGKVRKVHNLLYAPDFETVEKMQFELSKIGNIISDGRPILGFDSKDLLDLSLNINPDIFFIPAHIWTPWFSVLGEKGGFNSIEECFGDLTPYIYALETGLSTNPALNWMCSFLDRFTLLSNSDAHSPDRLGRNANILDCDFDYKTIFNAIKAADGKTFIGTIDMFPQEGKYHYDGHRKCNVCWDPVETLRNRAICPVCGRRVVIGVASRIAQLSDRTDISKRANRREFFSIIPLPEILSEITGAGESSKKVKQLYFNLLQKCNSEFDILLNHPPEFIESACGPVVGEAIRRMRNGQIIIQEGYDGEYGIIKVFQPGEHKQYEAGEKLFDAPAITPVARPLLNFDLNEYRRLVEENYAFEGVEEPEEEYSKDWLSAFNAEQRKAVTHYKGPALVLAGPGTGKTRVLTARITHLLNQYQVSPASILAITFTNKAAGEIRERIKHSAQNSISSDVHINTFHSLGLEIIKNSLQITNHTKGFILAGEDEKKEILKKITGKNDRECKGISDKIEKIKQQLLTEKDIEDEETRNYFIQYQQYLHTSNVFDLEDLIYQSYFTLINHPELAANYQKQFQWILIDEYQDINYSQYQLIRLLTGNNENNIFVIGDPNQSIYAFRGSDLSLIKCFTTDYPETSIYKLKKSYRCTDRIIQAATQVLNLISADEPINGASRGLKIRIDTHSDDTAEALFIARTIDELLGGMQFHTMDRGLKTNEESEIKGFSDIAVLCRTRQQMKIIEKVFADKNIPYQTLSNRVLYQQEPFKTILNILNLIVSPDNILIRDLLTNRNIDIEQILSMNLADFDIKTIIDKIQVFITGIKDKAQEFEWQLFLQRAENYGHHLDEFLYSCKLGTEIDTWQDKADKVSVMTIHASKGLEFGCVFIPGCEEGIIPYSLFREDTDIEEEIRLLYVGMTRASKYLYLSYAYRRTINKRELRLNRSPFLDKITQSLFEISLKGQKKEKPIDNQLKLF